MSSPAPQWLSAGLLALAFLVTVLIAVTRQLNFDESLALYSGWLYATRSETGLNFLMPIVLLIGQFGAKVPDPAAVLLSLRFLVLVTIALVFLTGKVQLKLPLGFLALWVLLTLSNGAFLTHALEFRYDWAILIPWMVGFLVIISPSRMKYPLLGLICAWLAFHHLKGAFYAIWLYAFSLVTIYLDGGNRIRSLIQLNAFLGLLAVAWIFIVLSLGRMQDLIDFYTRFAELSRQITVDESFSRIIARLQADAWWWMLSAAGLAFLLITRRYSTEVLWAIAFAAVPAMFIVLHPLPWAYLVVPMVPLLALTTTAAIYYILSLSGRQRNCSRLGLVLALTSSVYLAATLKEAIPQYQEASLLETARILRVIKANAKPGDRIIDPSGTVYFIQPAHPEWYTDTLFRELADRGAWQDNFKQAVENADWGLNTYRLNWLPDEVVQVIHAEMLIVCGPLYLRRDDLRLDTIKFNCSLSPTKIRSVW